jgi:hypothetical protein
MAEVWGMSVSRLSIRTWAFRCFIGFWGLFVAALLVPAVTTALERYKMVSSAADLMVTAAKATLHLTSIPWFAWIAGIGIGLVTGFTAGVWLDAILRHQDESQIHRSGVQLHPIGDLAIGESTSEFVHLSGVAALIYEGLGRCHVRDFIDRQSSDSIAILNVVGRIVANNSDIYGVRIPAKSIEKIDREELRGLKIVHGARSAGVSNGEELRIIYDALCIRRKDVARVSDAITNARHSSTLQLT